MTAHMPFTDEGILVPYYCTKLVSTCIYSLTEHSTTASACQCEMQAIFLHAFIQIYSSLLGEFKLLSNAVSAML